MENLLTDFGLFGLAFACTVALFAGLVKGAVGFAMPTILISGLSLYHAPDIALAALIFPTLVTNGMQAFRQGWAAAWASMRDYWIYLTVGGIFLLASAQLVAILSATALYLLIGCVVASFAFVQLAGWRPSVKRSRLSDGLVGAFAGSIGGMSGVWGPQTVTYLTAVGTPKVAQVRAQGVIFGLGAVALLVAHLRSGVMNSQTVWLSGLLVGPAIVGTAIGFRLQDRIDQTTFRRVTLIVLCFGGLSLIWRGTMG